MKKRIVMGKKKLNRIASAVNGRKTKSRKTLATRRSNSIKQGKSGKQTRITKKAKTSFIVRIMGMGQFRISASTARKLNEFDNAIVGIMRKADEQEFKERLAEMISLVENEHQPLDAKEIVSSDFIIPSMNTSIKEAREWFEGEGLIPENAI